MHAGDVRAEIKFDHIFITAKNTDKTLFLWKFLHEFLTIFLLHGSSVCVQVFTGNDGDRPGNNDILVVLMNGRTLDPAVASEYAEKLKVRGVRIVAVALGAETELFEDQIELIASSPADMRRVKFNELYAVGNYVLSGVCTVVESSGKSVMVETHTNPGMY